MNKNPEDYSRDKRGAGHYSKTFLRNNLAEVCSRYKFYSEKGAESLITRN